MVHWQFADFRRTHPAQPRLDKDISDYITKCKKDDPAPKPQLALPCSTVRWIYNRFCDAPLSRMRVVADLIVLAFFFLLRVGEYTPSNKPRQTIPLHGSDIRLWRDRQILPHNADKETLLTADAVTICLQNQKNGDKNAILHHTHSGDPHFCPVRSAARLVHALGGRSHLPLGSFVDERGQTTRITAAEIRSTIRIGAGGDDLESKGYDLTRIGSHSLRAGGATHLKLAGYDHDIIQKLGRWRSTTYLRYIQSQIGDLTAGIAVQMARSLSFFNVAP